MLQNENMNSEDKTWFYKPNFWQNKGETKIWKVNNFVWLAIILITNEIWYLGCNPDYYYWFKQFNACQNTGLILCTARW